MTQPGNNSQPPSAEGGSPDEAGPQAASPGSPGGGRYRYSAGSPLDPDEGVHPEMCEPGCSPLPPGAAPASPADLIAMQERFSSARPEKPERLPSAKVEQVLDLIDRLDNSAAEDLEIALRLVSRLESFHDAMVEELRDDPEASHNQLIAWAIDADRLMRARLLLESVDLE
jgi:hypothetical protein